MSKNKVVQFGLESRAIALKSQDKTFREIASTLTEESKQNISYSSVKRYFDFCETAAIQAVEKSDQLKAKVAEAEINTINECLNCITELKDICGVAKKAGNTKDAIQAIDKIYTGLDMLNKVLGKYPTGGPQVQFNFQEVNVDATREKITRRIDSIAARN